MRDQLLEFELALDRRASEKVVEYEWGRAFLSPSLPLAWDANWALVERAGMTPAEVVAAADEALAGYGHRAMAIRDEAEGERLASEIGAIPGWEAEKNLYMLWHGGEGNLEPDSEVLETPLSGCEELRRRLIREEFSPDLDRLEETADQLLEMGRRTSAAGGDRWFVAPPGQPASACCLLSGEGIGQVEDVGTLALGARPWTGAGGDQGRNRGLPPGGAPPHLHRRRRRRLAAAALREAGLRGMRRPPRPPKGPDSGDNRLRPSFVRGYKGAIGPPLLGSVMLFSRDQDFKSTAPGNQSARLVGENPEPMTRIRQQNVTAAQWSANGGALGAQDLTLPENNPFGQNVFSVAVQKERLPEDVFEKLQTTLEGRRGARPEPRRRGRRGDEGVGAGERRHPLHPHVPAADRLDRGEARLLLRARGRRQARSPTSPARS